MRILIVDDDATDREICRRALERMSDMEIEITEESSAESALEACSSLDPDLILLDHHLGPRDGLWLLDALHARIGGKLPPIVLLTGSDDASIARRAIERGAREWLAKDNISAVRIADVVRRARAESEVQERKAPEPPARPALDH